MHPLRCKKRLRGGRRIYSGPFPGAEFPCRKATLNTNN